MGLVATAQTGFPDVISLDILLREDDGVDVLYRLRKHEQIARILGVAVTALVRPRDRQRIAAAGSSDYLAKPYTIDELAAMIQAASVSMSPHLSLHGEPTQITTQPAQRKIINPFST